MNEHYLGDDLYIRFNGDSWILSRRNKSGLHLEEIKMSLQVMANIQEFVRRTSERMSKD